MAVKKTKSQIGKASRQKGARGEREVCNTLKKAFNEDFRRGYQRRVQADEPDIVGPEWFKFWAECKNMKAPNIFKAYHQARNDSDGRPPLVFTKKTNDPAGWLVSMDMPTFLSMLTWMKDQYENEQSVSRRDEEAEE